MLGEAVWLKLVVSTTGRPIPMLIEEGTDRVTVEITAPDGAVVRQEASRPYAWSGVTLLNFGECRDISVPTRLERQPWQPGRYRLSVFADLGWGPERATDPRRVSIEMDWATTPADLRSEVVQRQFDRDADHNSRRPPADLQALARPEFIPDLLQRAEAGSYRALDLIGDTPGAQAADALIRIAGHLPRIWTDREGNVNLGFALLQRLGDHLPPRVLPGERSWWTDPECHWRRETMAGVGQSQIDAARLVALAWLEREPWGAAEILISSARPEDRGPILAALSKHAQTTPAPMNHMHALWSLAHAAILADPTQPPLDPTSGLTEAFVWSAHGQRVDAPWDASRQQRIEAMLDASDPWLRRLAIWAVPKPVPSTMVVRIAALMTDADQELAETAIWAARTSTDPVILEAMLRVAAEPRFSQDYAIGDPLRQSGRRAAYADAIITRLITSAGARGDDAFRAFATTCLSVRPVAGSYSSQPNQESWLAAAARWRSWLAANGPVLAEHGPLPVGDPRQPDYLLPAGWWFEAADGRRFLRPTADL